MSLRLRPPNLVKLKRSLERPGIDVPQPKLEITDILRALGDEWRWTNTGHVALSQLKVMSAIDARHLLWKCEHTRAFLKGG